MTTRSDNRHDWFSVYANWKLNQLYMNPIQDPHKTNEELYEEAKMVNGFIKFMKILAAIIVLIAALIGIGSIQ